MEVWKNIPGVNGCQASSFGRIKRLEYIKRVNKVSKNGMKFSVDVLFKEIIYTPALHQVKSKNGNADYYGCPKGLIHRLIAKTFLPNPENKPEVNHKDGNGLNNKLTNIEWSTSGDNQRHAYKIGLRKPNININKNGRYAKG